jgi:sterol desaturase/sphingolipid hydroxylase (fatty acid hydroxylase superfamily)
VYALILDCADYWRHRLSHSFRSWYALHALHHAQRQMSFWSDDRNHLLDDLIAALWFGVVGLAIGIPPLQFPLLFLFMRFIESLSHANIKLSFGWLGDRLIVSPRFHRLHHGLRAAGRNSCNYGAVFPTWDILFRTADFSDEYAPTGDRRGQVAVISNNNSGAYNSSSLSSGRQTGAFAAIPDEIRRCTNCQTMTSPYIQCEVTFPRRHTRKPLLDADCSTERQRVE